MCKDGTSGHDDQKYSDTQFNKYNTPVRLQIAASPVFFCPFLSHLWS